ncbi:hypothetical protein L0F63_006453 [Massospora cicadina]|nr:hypothetical protein L0F63_006453 [Massospora cicadina]
MLAHALYACAGYPACVWELAWWDVAEPNVKIGSPRKPQFTLHLFRQIGMRLIFSARSQPETQG